MGLVRFFFEAMVDYHGFLNPSDGVAISFWIISIAMVAATVFFLMESMNVGYHWKTSMNVGALVTNLGGGMFWRLMIGTVAMLAFGYAGESKVLDPFLGFVLGMSGWGYILFEIFAGEAGKLASSSSVNK